MASSSFLSPYPLSPSPPPSPLALPLPPPSPTFSSNRDKEAGIDWVNVFFAKISYGVGFDVDLESEPNEDSKEVPLVADEEGYEADTRSDEDPGDGTVTDLLVNEEEEAETESEEEESKEEPEEEEPEEDEPKEEPEEKEPVDDD